MGAEGVAGTELDAWPVAGQESWMWRRAVHGRVARRPRPTRPLLSCLPAARAQRDAYTTEGRAPLHLAADAAYTDVVWALLEAGAGVNVRQTDGWTPLHLLLRLSGESPRLLPTLEVLLSFGASATAVNSVRLACPDDNDDSGGVASHEQHSHCLVHRTVGRRYIWLLAMHNQRYPCCWRHWARTQTRMTMTAMRTRLGDKSGVRMPAAALPLPRRPPPPPLFLLPLLPPQLAAAAAAAAVGGALRRGATA